MKYSLLIVITLLALSSPSTLYCQSYNEVGYSPIMEEWNVRLSDFIWQHPSDNPGSATGFYFQIQNNTTYTITAIDVELEFRDGARVFFKKFCQIPVAQCNPGDVMNTEVWTLDPPIISKYFKSKKFVWTYKVKNIYGPQ